MPWGSYGIIWVPGCDKGFKGFNAGPLGQHAHALVFSSVIGH